MKYKITKLPILIYNKLFADLLRSKWYAKLVEKNPRKAVNLKWLARYLRLFPWDNPQTLDEKIAWLQVNTDTSEWSQLSDKFEVRKYIKEQIGEEYLIPCYGVWDDVDDVDFDSLPDQFVIKCTHDSGSTIIVKDKNSENLNDLKGELNFFLKRKIGYSTFEPHYTKIKPRIIAEQLLMEENNNISSSIIDYKIWCFNGIPYRSVVGYNRHREADGHIAAVTELYQLDPWLPRREELAPHLQKQKFKDIPRPGKLDEILNVAEKLSTGFPQVRVDFYCVNNKVYFGEMTFTACAGINPYTRETQIQMGQQITLPYKKL